MIHVRTVEDNLALKNILGLEAAFRALVGYPKEELIDGIDDADILADLLYRVASALASDLSEMPHATLDVINKVVRCELKPSVTGDYASGSTVVREHKKHWHGIFLCHTGDMR